MAMQERAALPRGPPIGTNPTGIRAHVPMQRATEWGGAGVFSKSAKNKRPGRDDLPGRDVDA